MRAHQHRAAAGGGFDQVLAAQRLEAAAEQCHLRAAEIGRHFADGVAQPHIGLRGLWRWCVAPGAAAHGGEATACDQRGHLVEALRVAGHDQQQRAWVRVRRRLLLAHLRPCRQQGGFFAFARAGGQHHRAADGLPPGAAARELCGIGCHVELHIAAHLHTRCAHGPQALSVFGRLRQHQRDTFSGRPEQRLKAICLARAARAEPRIRQHHRDVAALRGMQQVGPDLGFHQHTDGRLKVFEEARHRTRRVERQPYLAVTGLQQGNARRAAGGGAVGQQQAHGRPLYTQGRDQGSCGPGFAERHRMQPHPAR